MSKIIKLPGLIDIHVHLRDPGQTNKEDFFTGTSAALAGGVTTVFDMPNNLKPIFTYDDLMEKIEIAQKNAVCDWGLYFGTDGTNNAEFERVKNHVVGLKIYLTMTTGKYILQDGKLLENVFAAWPKEKLIVVHAEGDKVRHAIDMARKYKSKLHITHVATKNDLQYVLEAKEEELAVTCDVTPHHLFLIDENMTTLHSFGKMKPELASKEDQSFLWENISKIDCIATDHAPHTRQEKESNDPPSGVPGLETVLPLLLTASKQGKITLDDMIRLTNTNPQKLFDYRQDSTTYIEVDREQTYTIENSHLKTKCGWSPFAGWNVQGKLKRVFIRGQKVFEDGNVLVEKGFGKNIIKATP